MSDHPKLFSPEFEYQLLGACMQRPETVAMHGVTADLFAIRENRMIFESIQELLAAGVPVDCFTVLEDLGTKNLTEECGGLAYVGPLMGAVAANPAQYAKTLREKRAQRALAEASNKLMEIAEAPLLDADDRIDQALTAVMSVKAEGAHSGPSTSADAVRDAVEFACRTMDLAEGETLGLPTGIAQLDMMLNGLNRGDLIVVAGRPSMGKSSLGMQIAEVNAKQRRNVLVYTLEMSKSQLMLRTLSGVSKVPLSRIMRGMSGEECQRFTEAGGIISGWPMHIDESPALTIGKIASRAKRNKIRHGLDLIVIDQLTHIRLPGNGRKHEEMGDVTKRAKALAKELDVPVVLLHQLRRPGDGKVSRPDMTMLKDSGSVEEDADVIILAHRPHYYDDTENPTYAELIVEKNRMGSRGTVKCGWAGEYTRFTQQYDPIHDRAAGMKKNSAWDDDL